MLEHADADELDIGALEVVVQVDGEEHVRGVAQFDWEEARQFAADGTALHPGDVLAGPPLGRAPGLEAGRSVEVAARGIGLLRQRVASEG